VSNLNVVNSLYLQNGIEKYKNRRKLIWLEVIFPRFKILVFAVYRSPGAVISYWENFHISIERAFAQLITNPFAPGTLPYLYVEAHKVSMNLL
jgi:hypothetical protein